jgi:hypothetical protein
VEGHPLDRSEDVLAVRSQSGSVGVTSNAWWAMIVI